MPLGKCLLEKEKHRPKPPIVGFQPLVLGGVSILKVSLARLGDLTYDLRNGNPQKMLVSNRGLFSGAMLVSGSVVEYTLLVSIGTLVVPVDV